MQCQEAGLSMNTENLLEYNPKLADVTHTTRVAYAKFMSTKIKKEIMFEDEQVQIQNEVTHARETRAFNKFKLNAGILKKSLAESTAKAEGNTSESGVKEKNIESIVEPSDLATDIRMPTTIMEDPNEDCSPISPSTPENIIDESVPKISPSPIPLMPLTRSPSPIHQKISKIDSPIVKPKSLSNTSDSTSKSPELSIHSPELPIINVADSSKLAEVPITEGDEENDTDDVKLHVPSPPSRRNSLSPSFGDKGKSKITGKTLTGWL